MPSEIVPVVENRPFRIPRAMSAVPLEVAPRVTALEETTPGKLVASPCSKAVNYNAPKSTPAEDRQFVASMQKVIEVLKANPLFPPPGFEVKMNCSFERRTDSTGIYRGQITLLFYPYSDKNHYWHGALEILINDLGVMGPRNNGGDRANDASVDFHLPAPATYRGEPFLQNEHGVWGGIYLSNRPQDIYRTISYREWIEANLPRLQEEYAEHKAAEEAAPKVVRKQVTRRNFQSMYERTLVTKQRTPSAELDTQVWLADMAPSDAANTNASRLVRLNVPSYFNRKLPSQAVQLINILPMHTKYNHLHAVLEKLDFAALRGLLQ